ncbi:hypothetical protein V8D89_009672 [Ganoderma adspersum]
MSNRDGYRPPGINLGDAWPKGRHLELQPQIPLVVIDRNASRRYLSLLGDQIAAVLVSQFLLDLQSANRRSLKLSTNDSLHISTCSSGGGDSIAFARVVGSLGEGFVAPGSLVSDPEDDDFGDACYGSRSTQEDGGLELAETVCKGGDVKATMPDATVDS